MARFFVVRQQILYQVNENLSTNSFITVHISNVFKHRLTGFHFVNFVRNLNGPKMSSFHGLSNRMQSGNGRVFVC